MYFTISLVLLSLLHQLHHDLDPWLVRKLLEALERTHRAGERSGKVKDSKGESKIFCAERVGVWSPKISRGVELVG